MEVVRSQFDGGIRKGGEPGRFHMDYVVLILKRAFDQKESAARDDEPILFIKIRCDDHVRNAGLVLHRDEDEALRRARSLACNNAAGGPDKFSAAAVLQLFR